ncbi:MAG: DUF3368 domain-containing protein [Imperialibacter sp.]|uniref:DUF3368 domain-containing protein n=1 Tax=Imperialibacter sp. TaxID=2038411 RepID=UPI0032EBFCA2
MIDNKEAKLVQCVPLGPFASLCNDIILLLKKLIPQKYCLIRLLGILVQAKTVGLIPLLKPEIEILTSKIEFRLHQKLIQAALDAVGE